MKENAVKKTSFTKGIKAELRQIHWPKKGLLIKQTFVVVIATAVLAGLCVLADANAMVILEALS